MSLTEYAGGVHTVRCSHLLLPSVRPMAQRLCSIGQSQKGTATQAQKTQTPSGAKSGQGRSMIGLVLVLEPADGGSRGPAIGGPEPADGGSTGPAIGGPAPAISGSTSPAIGFPCRWRLHGLCLGCGTRGCQGCIRGGVWRLLGMLG